MNEMPIKSATDTGGEDYTGSELYSMLPNSTEAFNVKYIEVAHYHDFYDQVYQFRNEDPIYPYKYGSY